MTAASIRKMSTEEKISTMEMIWDDLCQHHNVDSPDWHQDVLLARESKRNSAQEKPINWAEAKQSILNQIK